MSIDRTTEGAYRVKDHRADQERAHHVGIVIGPELSAWVARDVRDLRVVAMAWGTDATALRHADLPKQPRSVTFVSLPEWSTLVPDGALEPGTTLHHLKLVHGKLPTTAVREEPVATLGAQCLYVNTAEHERMVLDRFPIARSLPLQAVLVNGARTRSANGPVLVMHRGAERLDVAIADKGTLLLSSSYPARTAEDMLYFCLMAAERCGFAPGTIAVRSGGTHLVHFDRELLSRYFTDHSTAVPRNATDIWPADADAGRWLAAFDQFACVS